MKAAVNEHGVLIPKELLEGVNEVEIRKEDHMIVVIPTMTTDPILELGRNPVSCGVTDASERHDTYLTGPSQ